LLEGEREVRYIEDMAGLKLLLVIDIACEAILQLVYIDSLSPTTLLENDIVPCSGGHLYMLIYTS
jgi:hypothetical protein